jgi:hypothetical protein
MKFLCMGSYTAEGAKALALRCEPPSFANVMLMTPEELDAACKKTVVIGPRAVKYK